MDPLAPLEALLVGTRRKNRWPPTFVVGAPRCGTTVVGLHLTNRLRFAFLPNVAKEHPRSPWLRTRRALAREARYEPSWTSRYGKVEGPLSPSDGWDVLERWFPSYREARAGRARERRGLVSLVARLEELYGAPFLCKNNANSMRIEALAELFPDALFVAVRRALPEAVSSLLEARRRHGVALGRWWSAAPPQLLGSTFAEELEQVVATILGLERYLAERFAALDPARVRWVDYEAFCARPEELVDWLRTAYGRAGVRLEERGGEAPERFAASALEPAERAALERRIAPLAARLGAAVGAAEGT